MPSFDAVVPETPLNILMIGAHIDDCELRAGGVAAKYRKQGHSVRFVSVTNGEAGHHETPGPELVERRRQEAAAAGAVIGAEYMVLDYPDGRLQPTLENRDDLIRLIREEAPDLILTHRPNDYHPDHRYTAALIRDSAYMVTVPHICPETGHLDYNPVIAYLNDDFQKPYPFDPDVVVGIDDVIDEKLEMLHQHTSQIYEWLPHNTGKLDEVPEDEDAQYKWLKEDRLPQFEKTADKYRDLLIDRYGPERGKEISYAEAFEHCEYGGPLTDVNEPVLFPFGSESSE